MGRFYIRSGRNSFRREYGHQWYVPTEHTGYHCEWIVGCYRRYFHEQWPRDIQFKDELRSGNRLQWRYILRCDIQQHRFVVPAWRYGCEWHLYGVQWYIPAERKQFEYCRRYAHCLRCNLRKIHEFFHIDTGWRSIP